MLVYTKACPITFRMRASDRSHHPTEVRAAHGSLEPTEQGGPRRSRVPVRIDAYIPARLAALDWSFDTEVTAAIADAQSAVVEAQSYAKQVGLSTIANQLLRSESMASSQMEGVNVPSHRALVKTDVGRQHRPGAQAALANVEAVRWAYEWARGTDPFSVDGIRAIHERLAAADRWLAPFGGQIRERQNWVGTDRHTPAGAEFVPPPPEEVAPLLEDLCSFLNRVDLPPVAQTAIAHAQFETVHPFPDGNGRVGRALIGASLTRSRICREVVPPLSLILARDKAAYVSALTAFRFSSPRPWLLLLAESLEIAARASTQLAASIVELQDRWREQVGRVRADSSVDRIIRALPGDPMLSAERAAAITGRTPTAARNALAALEAAGVLQLVTVGRRNRVWESKGLFALIDEMERDLSGGAVGTSGTGGN